MRLQAEGAQMQLTAVRDGPLARAMVRVLLCVALVGCTASVLAMSASTIDRTQL